MQAFLAPTSRCIVVPGTTETVEYDPVKRMGVITTKLGQAGLSLSELTLLL